MVVGSEVTSQVFSVRSCASCTVQCRAMGLALSYSLTLHRVSFYQLLPDWRDLPK